MKLCIDARMTRQSGIGVFLSGVLPYFAASEKLLILVPENFTSTKNLKNAEYLFCGVKMFSVREMFFFPKVLLKRINECDAYFTPYCNVPGGIKIPVFVTIHDVIFLDMKEIAGRTGTFIRRLFYLRAVNKARCVFTVSRFSAKRISFHLKPKKISTVYNGVSPYVEEAMKTPHIEKENANEILFVGNLKAHKGLKTLLEAFAIFRKKQSEMNVFPLSHLIVAGSGDKLRTKEKALASFSDAEGVNFIGRVSEEELSKLYLRARVLVSPSLYEGFGIPPLEALCFGTPVILSDIEVYREIYAGYPVHFFEAGNSHDLAAKLEEVFASPLSLPSFNMTYSYKKTAEKILGEIKVCTLH